jgi:hypothetical protein
MSGNPTQYTTSPLYTYMQQLQRLIGFDEHQALYNPDDLIAFINIARAEVAAQGQCIRRLSPAQSSIMTLQVIEPGIDYTAPTLSISTPDAPSGSLPYPAGLQATGVCMAIGGGIATAGLTNGGNGYFQPTVTVNDPTGTGAVIQPTLGPIWQTQFGQEEYNFSEIPLGGFAGVANVLAIRSVSFNWNNWQWSASRVSFSKYQALIRQYVASFYAPPVWCCQFGQGIDGSYKLYPLPDQPYSQSADCICLPFDLYTDTDYEAIPQPWRRAVPYFAAHLCLLSKAAEVPQMLPLASTYFNERSGGLFQVEMRRARAFAQPGYASSYYGRV